MEDVSSIIQPTSVVITNQSLVTTIQNFAFPRTVFLLYTTDSVTRRTITIREEYLQNNAIGLMACVIGEREIRIVEPGLNINVQEMLRIVPNRNGNGLFVRVPVAQPGLMNWYIVQFTNEQLVILRETHILNVLIVLAGHEAEEL